MPAHQHLSRWTQTPITVLCLLRFRWLETNSLSRRDFEHFGIDGSLLSITYPRSQLTQLLLASVRRSVGSVGWLVVGSVIQLPGQSVGVDKEGLPVTLRKQSLKELLQQSGHYNPKVRRGEASLPIPPCSGLGGMGAKDVPYGSNI